MNYLIIARWDDSLIPSSINHRETEREAQALVDKLIHGMPKGEECLGAFYVENPGVSPAYITVDPATKTVSINTAKKKLAEWKESMAESDKGLSRSEEEMWDAIGIEKASAFVREKHVAKKEIRARKP